MLPPSLTLRNHHYATIATNSFAENSALAESDSLDSTTAMVVDSTTIEQVTINGPTTEGTTIDQIDTTIYSLENYFESEYKFARAANSIHAVTVCAHDQAYLSILITVLPLWAMLTTILVFVLIQFHRSSRATKIYDNCTKTTAQYIYHIELRTGDNSATYNRRRTTITIDMFDDQQNTLARIAIPGHIIFGRKENPTMPIVGTSEQATLDQTIDNATVPGGRTFNELRCTRLWLYRAVRLKRVNTIRVTHSCLESDARIMIYGIELKSSELDKMKLFFPVMHYISAWGSVLKPNACFDHEPLGSISALGGKVPETSSMIGDQLTLVDYALMLYFYCSLVFYFSTYDFIENSFTITMEAIIKGLLLGVGCYLIVIILTIFFSLTIKHQYSIHIGLGIWSYLYFIFGLIIILIATSTWIYSAIIAYKTICSNTYNLWLLSICISGLISLILSLISSLIIWLCQPTKPDLDPYPLLPPLLPTTTTTTATNEQSQDYQQQQQQDQQFNTNLTPLNRTKQQFASSKLRTTRVNSNLTQQQQMAAPAMQQNPIWLQPQQQYINPTMSPHSGAAQQPTTTTIGQQAYSAHHQYQQPQQPTTIGQMMAATHAQQQYGVGSGSHQQVATGNAPIYRQPINYHLPTSSSHQQQQQQLYGENQPNPMHHSTAIQYNYPTQQPHNIQGHTISPPTQMVIKSPQANVTYHQQTTQIQSQQQQQQQPSGGGIKPSVKKIGSNESTGSTYYQQVMKTKGGVKSISQYGELLKQQKRATAKKQ